VFDAIRRHADDHRWLPFVFPMCDEPRVRETTARIIESVKFLKNAAPWLPMAGSYSVSFAEKDDPLLVQALFRELDVSILNEHDRRVMNEGRKLGKDILIYNQGRSRYTFGAYLWSERAKGVKGFCQWHMFATHGYQFFDLDGREPDDGIIALRTEGIRPTLDLERVRTGVTDFRYLLTLSNLAARARKQGLSRAAGNAEGVLREVAEKLRLGERDKPAWLDLDALRGRVSAEIVRLRESGRKPR
jgi:hypothetical protein